MGHLKSRDNWEIQEKASYSCASWIVSLVTIITYCFYRTEDWENSFQIASHRQRLFLTVLTAFHSHTRGFPGGIVVKNLPANAGDAGLIPGSGRPLEEEMATHSNFLAGESHGQKSLADYSPWGPRELDTAEWLKCILGYILFSNSSSSIDFIWWSFLPSSLGNSISQKSEK